MSYEDFRNHFDVVEICFLKFPYSLLEVESQVACFISVARKNPRLLPNEKTTAKSLLAFKLNLAETINFEDLKKMINFAAFNSEIKKNGKYISHCPRFHDQWKGSQRDLYRLTSHKEEFFIRIYFCCQISDNDLIVLKRISVHLKIVNNCVELYKSKCTRIKIDSCMTRLISIKAENCS